MLSAVLLCDQNNPDLLWLFIEDPHAKIQIRGKGHPQEVGDLQQGGRFVDFAESKDHQQDQRPQDHQPDERKTERPEFKENDAPEKI